ncbi:MAG: hypothetical protein K6F89_07210 [Prevotella sp.]|nr:hypothetical protein [Prevotella sp.]
MSRNYNYIRKPELPTFSLESKTYHIVSGFLAQKRDKLNMARLACQLKNLGNNALASDALRELSRVAPLATRVVWGNSCPKEVKQLGNGDNSFFFKPQSLEREFNWTILGLRPYKKLLAEFVALRDSVERHILLGNYDDAKALLEESVRKFGYSVWYYEMRLTIAGYQDKVAECYALYTQVNEAYKEVKGLGIVSILVQNLGNRSLSKTPMHYDNVLVTHFKRNQDPGSRLDYYLFRLNYYQYYNLDCLAEVVEMEHIQSAIDRYTILLYVLRSFYAAKPEQRPQALRFAHQLYKLTEDPQLLAFLALSDLSLLPDSYYDASFIAILDNYYTGQYETCADLCRSYLERDPSNLYVIKIYCRSLMFLHNGFKPVTNNNNSLLYTITFNTYKVMVEKVKTPFVDKLNQVLKNIYGLRIAASLDRFVKSEQRESHAELIDHLTTTQFDPFFIKAFDDEEQQIAYLEQGLQHVPVSAAIQYRKQCVERNISSDSPVVAYIRDVDTAKITFEHEDYESALEQWKSIFDKNHDSIPTAQTAVEYIFRSLVALGTEYRQEAVQFYTDCYIENHSFVSKIDTSGFMDDIKQSRYKGLRNDLDLMLFVFLNADKYPQKQFVLEQCCKFEHVNLPSDLIGKFGRRGDPVKVELFFSILLTDDILYHHYKLHSTNDVLDEKLKIVNYLMTQYPDEQRYSDIFTELMHEMVAYRGMNKLDDSKIYVNEDAVMKYELCDIEPLYDRFCKQAELSRKGGTLVVVGDYSLSDPAGLTEILKDTVSYSNDAVADVATELFSMIRHAFLKSRFGLGTYLSTRIRHGVFDGEMRSFLKELDLILSTEGSSYVANTHWPHEYHLDSTSCDILNRALKKFSRDTDELISTFKDSVIQIRENNKDTNGGMFCYDQTTEEISRHLLAFQGNSKDAQEFCHKVMDWLWEITEQCLEKIRDKVQNELKPSYTYNISLLEQSLEQITSHTTFRADIHNAINKAREELTTRLVKVEKWFYRQEAKPEDFKLSDYAKMAFDTTDKYSTEVNVNMNVSMPTNEPLFKAQYSASMFDLLLIFFKNMFNYSFEEFERPVKFHVDIDDENIMHWYLENKLRQDTDEEVLNKLFQERIGDEKRIQKEGGSGLVKAMNIIRFDFGEPKNYYKIVASEGKCLIDVYINLTNMTVDPDTLNFEL